MKKHFAHYLICIPLTCGLLATSCQRYTKIEGPVLSRINIIDREGFTTTIQSPDRLRNYQNTNFLAPQAYEKVMGMYQREPNGSIRSFITSYYPNGQVHQYLDVINARANGIYREWHENGNLKLEAHIMGGDADLTQEAMRSWVFEGRCQVWNPDKTLQAYFDYNKGKLEGESIEYHANGSIYRRRHFHENLLEGIEEIFDNQGTLLECAHYEAGLHHGVTTRYWTSSILMAEEHFTKDCLYTGRYYDNKGTCVSVIDKGAGFRIIFDQKKVRSREQYKNGFPLGLMELYDTNGALTQSYHQKEGKKQGEEIYYYAPTSLQELLANKPRPKISLQWDKDQLQGIAKTWYENGQPESQREMSQNARNGIASAWYRNGRLMFMEEYEHDKLIKGKYFRRGERHPISTVEEGTGEATIYDGEGRLLRKTQYFHSEPVLE